MLAIFLIRIALIQLLMSCQFHLIISSQINHLFFADSSLALSSAALLDKGLSCLPNQLQTPSLTSA